MQLNDALQQAAARGQVLTVTEYVFSPPDGFVAPGDTADSDAAYAAGASVPPGSADGVDVDGLKKKISLADERIHLLTAQLAEIAAAGSSGAPMQSDALSRIAELEQQLANAKSSGGNGSGGADPGAVLASFETYPAKVLGLTEKAQKGVDKVECITVGDVKAMLLSGRLAAKGKGNGALGRAELIEIGNKLLGQVPTATPPPAVAVGGGVSGAPAGVVPKDWDRLLVGAYRKEVATTAERGKLEQAQQALATLKAQQMTPDTQKSIQDWEARYHEANKMHAMFEGQVATLLFAMGLNHVLKDVRTVSGALEQAGLHHLVQQAPAPVEAPPAAAPPAAATA